MDRGTMIFVCQWFIFIHKITRDVENASENLLTNGNSDRLAGVNEGHPALEAVRSGHSNRAHPAVTKVLLNFENQLGVYAVEDVLDLKCVVDFRQLAGFGEIGVDDGADDLDDGSLVAHKKWLVVSDR